MQTTAAYVRECLLPKYKNPEQRAIRLSKIQGGKVQTSARGKWQENSQSHKKEPNQIPDPTTQGKGQDDRGLEYNEREK
jgi:hypothetical protein